MASRKWPRRERVPKPDRLFRCQRAGRQSPQPFRPGPRFAVQRHCRSPLGQGMKCPVGGHNGGQ
eukprot:11187403-Lingulodinium_polyedra.AAC.1